MPRLPERIVALAPDERLTLAQLSGATLEPVAVRLRRAAETGRIDVTDPILRRWMSSRRDALLTADSDHGELALIARLLSDALDAAAA
ncbi:hypothetical protein [Conexibacter woesei]|uniref:hypothetical protein n=1 Tax=Conexibacter woesei TaxID=191495 RepID=UPI00041B34BD|nr:hypothetical protein [Conexibacter woesei]